MYTLGMKSHVEQALTRELDPSLAPSFSCGTSGSSEHATISSVLLQQWFSAHFPASTFRMEKEEGFHGQEQLSAANTHCSNGVARGDPKAVAESRLTSSSVRQIVRHIPCITAVHVCLFPGCFNTGYSHQ